MKASKTLRIVFMGTADFAVPSLEALLQGGYQVMAIVTMPDKPMGRGHKLKGSAVKECALKHGINVLQPINLNDEAFISELRSLKLDIGVVVAFRMLPQAVWQLPRMGTINLHGSLLPDYRGAAPIHWAVMNGDAETGVSTFLLKHEIDTGDVLLQASTPIGAEETVGIIHDRLMHIGAGLLLRTLDELAEGSITRRKQEEMTGQRRAAPKLFKTNCKIDWQRTSQELSNFVRGLSPYPTAWCILSIKSQTQVTAKIFAARAIPSADRHNGLTPGTVVIHEHKSIEVICGQGVLELLILQIAGKKAMSADAYLHGLH